MVISLLGPSGIKCQVADFSLLIDPPDKKKGNLVLETRTELNKKDFPEESVISGAGEYEVSGIRIKGINLKDEGSEILKTAYAIRFDDIRLGALNGLQKTLSQDALDKLGEIDILFIDIESSALDKKEVTALIKKIEPNILIAMTDKGAKQLIEEFGQKTNKEEKLTIKAKDINKEEGVKVVWLKSE
ncbi:MAG: MBL fold metallo-hydrolase [Patescibacteria group bacterium]